MLELSAGDLRHYWRELNPTLADLIGAMDRAEPWTLDDDPEVAKRLVALGHRMHGRAAAKALANADRADLLLFLAYISSSRAFRVIGWLDEMEGLGSDMVNRLLRNEELVSSVVPQEPLRELLAHRLRALHNTPYFAQLFAPDRLASVERAITRYREEQDHASA
jgi:hypothetical protein